MKLIKLLFFCALQMPISVFYYLDPSNPIYFLIYQFLITVFLWMEDNMISTIYHDNQALNYNFQEILKKILKPIPKTPSDKDFPEFEEEV